MRTHTLIATIFAASTLLAACGDREGTDGAPTGAADPLITFDHFMSRIAEHCGEAFRGRVVENRPPMDDDPFADRELVMHVRECSDERIKIPFHVGEDRSRTWVLTRTDYGIQLKHDHRHEDGSEDELTMYGGDTDTQGTIERMEFPVDQESIDLFREHELSASLTNVWAMEIVPNERFVYELAREDQDRLLRVEFDLSSPVEPPPAPWGHE